MAFKDLCLLNVSISICLFVADESCVHLKETPFHENGIAIPLPK